MADTVLYTRIATVLLAIAFLLHLIAIGSPWWANTDSSKTTRAEHIGLWKYCTSPIGGGESCFDFVEIITGDWLKAAQSFMILSLFTLPAAVGICAMAAFVANFSDNVTVLGGAAGITAITGIFTLICVAVWGGRFQEYYNNKDPMNWAGQSVGVLDWAFGLAVTDCILTFMALGLLAGRMATLESDDDQVKYNLRT